MAGKIMTKERTKILKDLKDYIEANKKECQSMAMKLRDILGMYEIDIPLSISIPDEKGFFVKDYKQSSLSIYYNLLNNAPDHLIIYNPNGVFYENKRRKINLFVAIKAFRNGFLLDLPTYPELHGYAWDKKIADKLGTDKYFDKELRDRILNKDIFVSIITKR